MYVDQSRRFSDSYCLQRVINKGTQATVWEATSLSIDDDNVYAVKIFDKSSLTTSWDQTQLKSEIFFLQEFDHPHIIRLMDVFEDASSCYVVTERLHGDLFDRIVRKTHYSERDGRDVSRILCKAVVLCHVHTTADRDVKPENLLLVVRV
jgi:serine/threonine protein kinase